MENEVSYEEIEELQKSGNSGPENIEKVCSYFGMNGSTHSQIESFVELGIPFSDVINALDKGMNGISGHGNKPKITDISLGEKDGEYALIVRGKCGKTDRITVPYLLNDFRPIKNNSKY